MVDERSKVAEEQCLSQYIITDLLVINQTFNHSNQNIFTFLFQIQQQTMRNSNSLLPKDQQRESESQPDLPQEWDYLSKRLAEVEKGLTLLEKKQIKLEKKLNNNTRQINEYNAQLTQQLLRVKNNVMGKIDVKQEILKYIEVMEKQVKSSCLQTISSKLDGVNVNFHDKTDHIELKIKSIYDQTKTYVDRAIFQLKQLLKKYVREQGDLERKIDKSSIQNSPSFMPRSSVGSLNSLNKSKSAKKLVDSNHKTEQSQKQKYQNNWLQKSRDGISKQSATGTGTNRVSYLREKLKQFEKINKKYQGQSQKSSKKDEKQEMIKKMNKYRDYLEQSESQLEPSNILTSEQVNGYALPKKSNFGLF